MTSRLTPPIARIPIGIATVAGQAVEVMAHPEWLRYLTQALLDRAGGRLAMTNTELADALSALQASEMLAQPAAPDAIPGDIVQSAGLDAMPGDITQSGGCDSITEMVMQA